MSKPEFISLESTASETTYTVFYGDSDYLREIKIEIDEQGNISDTADDDSDYLREIKIEIDEEGNISNIDEDPLLLNEIKSVTNNEAETHIKNEIPISGQFEEVTLEIGEFKFDTDTNKTGLLDEVKIESCEVKTESSEVKIEIGEVKVESDEVKIEIGEVKIESDEVKFEINDVKIETDELDNYVNIKKEEPTFENYSWSLYNETDFWTGGKDIEIDEVQLSANKTLYQTCSENSSLENCKVIDVTGHKSDRVDEVSVKNEGHSRVNSEIQNFHIELCDDDDESGDEDCDFYVLKFDDCFDTESNVQNKNRFSDTTVELQPITLMHDRRDLNHTCGKDINAQKVSSYKNSVLYENSKLPCSGVEEQREIGDKTHSLLNKKCNWSGTNVDAWAQNENKRKEHCGTTEDKLDYSTYVNKTLDNFDHSCEEMCPWKSKNNIKNTETKADISKEIGPCKKRQYKTNSTALTADVEVTGPFSEICEAENSASKKERGSCEEKTYKPSCTTSIAESKEEVTPRKKRKYTRRATLTNKGDGTTSITESKEEDTPRKKRKYTRRATLTNSEICEAGNSASNKKRGSREEKTYEPSCTTLVAESKEEVTPRKKRKYTRRGDSVCNVKIKDLKKFQVFSIMDLKYDASKLTDLCSKEPMDIYKLYRISSDDLACHQDDYIHYCSGDCLKKTNKIRNCLLCPEQFHTVCNVPYENHVLKHTENKVFKCPLCSKKFPLMQNVYIHLDSHTKVRYECPDCDKIFYHKHKLFYHQCVHRDAVPFRCKGCGDLFFNSQELINHRKTSVEKPFACVRCHTRFKYFADLKTHRKDHITYKRMYTCEQCSESFNYSGHLASHLELYHRRDMTYLFAPRIQRHWTSVPY